MTLVKNYKTFVDDSKFFDEFKYLYNNAPRKLKNEIDKTKTIEQNLNWHPENFVYVHIMTVTNRLYNTYHDKNLSLCGFLHDLGKIYTTEFDEKMQNWVARDHEDKSFEMLDDYKDWIKEQGGNFELISFVVKNHMRYKYMDEMRESKKEELRRNPYFKFLQLFNTADYGGTELVCRDINTLNKER